MKIPTKSLPAVVQKMIQAMRDGQGKRDAYPGEQRPKAKRFAPREVSIRFVAGKHAVVELAAYSLRAVEGERLVTSTPDSWQGSDGEFNTTITASYRGPVVTAHGYGGRYGYPVELVIPTGHSDKSRTGRHVNPDTGLTGPIWVESDHRRAALHYTKRIAAGDVGMLQVLCDMAFEERAFVLPMLPEGVTLAPDLEQSIVGAEAAS